MAAASATTTRRTAAVLPKSSRRCASFAARRTRRYRYPTATWRWRTARAARSAPATAPPPSSWKGSRGDGPRARIRATDPQVSRAAAQFRDAGVLGRRGRRQALDQEMRLLRRAALLPARPLPVLLQRQDELAAGLGQRHDLHLQRDAPRRPGPLRDRLRDPRRGPDDDDQHRR